MKGNSYGKNDMSILKKLTVCAFISGMIAGSASASVMLHAFNWNYSEIEAKASEIAELGYKKVLVSPPYKSSGDQWWARYQPQDYRVIDSPLGNKKDFSAMIEALNSKGVDVYADLVLNHMANEAWKRKDLNYPGSDVMNQYAEYSDYFEDNKLFGDINVQLFSAADFHPANCITDYNDVWTVQHYRLCGGNGDPGLPDLNYGDWVTSQQRQYVNALKELGIKGFRIDAAKHMTFDQLNKIFTPEIKEGVELFGELITHGGRGQTEYDRFLKPYLDRTSHSAYDFPLFMTIRSAFSFNGSFTELNNPEYREQAIDPRRSISFAITHDIVLNEGFRHLIMNEVDEKLANAYLIASGKTTPLVYSDHGESGEVRWVGAHNSPEIAKMIQFHNDMEGQVSEVIQDSNCIIFIKRGSKGFAGINKCATDITVDAYFSGLFTEQLSGKTIPASNGFVIPARSFALWKVK